MSYDTAPAIIDALRVHLLACPAFLAAGGSIQTIHYPRAVLTIADEPRDRLFPLAVLEQVTDRHTTFAVGAAPLRGGSLRITLTATGTVGEIEQLAVDVKRELVAQQSGIFFVSIDIGMAGEPPPEQLAAAAQDDGTAVESYSIVLDITHGLSA
jgi:hypothetical protein